LKSRNGAKFREDSSEKILNYFLQGVGHCSWGCPTLFVWVLTGIDLRKRRCYTKSTMVNINKNQQLSENERKGLSIIRNWIFHKGRNPSIRELTKEMGFGSTRSAFMLVNRLIEKKIILRKEDDSLRIINNTGSEKFSAKTVNVPLVGTVSCGAPIFAQENIEAYFPVSSILAHAGSRYFLLRAQGDSMDKAGISDGDILLVRQQSSAENGQIIIALIDDEATAKEFHCTNESIILKPRSSNKIHKPIILNKDFQIQGVVVTTIPDPDKL